MKCKLCNMDVEKLCNSHIISEFLYKNTYDTSHRTHGIISDGRFRILQSGLKEKLLCESCEKILSSYESYFNNNFVSKGYIPDFVNNDLVNIKIDDILMFKLFHLSNLFRASISSLPSFSNIHLGPHEKRIGNLLLNKVDNKNYRIFASVLYNKEKKTLKNIVIMPAVKTYKKHCIYQIGYAGCIWFIKISSHQCDDIDSISLNDNGEFYIDAGPIEELSEIYTIKKSLSERRLRDTQRRTIPPCPLRSNPLISGVGTDESG